MESNPFLTADVPDPTDFPAQSEAPGLRTLDAAMRCPICGEVYDAPVSISCGHTYCSACIRSALSTKQECPQCRKTANEVHIRVNHTIEDVISSWKYARPFVLNLIQSEAKRKAQAELDRAASRKRRRIERSESVEIVESGPSNPMSRTASSSNSTSRPASPVKPKSSNHKPKSKTAGGKDLHVIPSSDAEEDEDLSSTAKNRDNAPDDSTIVQCPICQSSLKYRHMNPHMDSGCVSFKREGATSGSNTTNGKKEKEAWSSIFGGGAAAGKGKNKKKPQSDKDKQDEDDPLPMATYATLKDRQLKEMLLEHELPTTGDRASWEERHKRWVMIYNANLDRSPANRKKKSELRKDLKKWEEDHTRKKKVVVGDSVAYQKTHKAEFTKLVEAAKQNRPVASSSKASLIGKSTPTVNCPATSMNVESAPPSSQPTEIIPSSQSQS